MDITVKIPERLFRTAKTPEQVADEIRQAAALFWVARGDVAAEAMGEITTPSPPDEEGTAPKKAAGFKDFLRSMPNVGDDSDFERPVDYGRPEVEWDT
jgi:hypothetical protein